MIIIVILNTFEVTFKDIIMKKLFTLLALALASFTLSAQTLPNWVNERPELHKNFQELPRSFSFESSSLLWKKVYKVPGWTAEKIRENFLISERTDKVIIDLRDVHRNEIHGFFNVKLNYKSFGYKRRDIPQTLRQKILSGHVILQFHDGEYRVLAYTENIPCFIRRNDMKLVLVEKNTDAGWRAYLKRSKRKGAEFLQKSFNLIFSMDKMNSLIEKW